ncbi:MAG: hypothetical protein R2712_23430 [Vicinamibacterales bacterium]
MRIDRLELFLCRLPLVHFFETSFGRTYDRTFVLARMEGDGHEGWGEAVAEGHPYYSGETTETVWHIVTSFLAPLVVGREFEHPRDIFGALKRVRTHNMAKALLEMTAWTSTPGSRASRCRPCSAGPATASSRACPSASVTR